MWERKIKELVNLTPHPLNLVGSEGELVIPPSGRIARAREERELIEYLILEGRKIPVYKVRYGEVIDLPPPEPGVIYVVSSITAQAVARTDPGRDDVVIPGDPVRDEAGRIIGMRGVCRI